MGGTPTPATRLIAWCIFGCIWGLQFFIFVAGYLDDILRKNIWLGKAYSDKKKLWIVDFIICFPHNNWWHVYREGDNAHSPLFLKGSSFKHPVVGIPVPHNPAGRISILAYIWATLTNSSNIFPNAAVYSRYKPQKFGYS